MYLVVIPSVRRNIRWHRFLVSSVLSLKDGTLDMVGFFASSAADHGILWVGLHMHAL